MEDREQKDLARSAQLTALLKGGQCMWATLAAYFGDKTGACRTSCQMCLHGPVTLRGVSAEDETAKKQRFERLVEKVEASPLPVAPNVDLARMLAKFLVGVSSPGMPSAFGRTAKAVKEHPLFGVMEDFSFVDVLETSVRIMRGTKRQKV
jgi:hypothetical protein